MEYEIELPDLGPDGGDHATVSEWNFEEGEFVEAGEVLAEVTCDAGTIEVLAARAGVLLEKVVDEDDIVRIGETVAVLEVEETDESDEQIVEEEEEESSNELPVYDEEDDEEDDEDGE